jgi:hypothetical protein
MLFYQDDYKEVIYQQNGATLESCIRACREDDNCESIAFAAKYTECFFYSAPVEGTHLVEDVTSNFAIYDLNCDFCLHPAHDGVKNCGERKGCRGKEGCGEKKLQNVVHFAEYLAHIFKQISRLRNQKDEKCGEKEGCGEGILKMHRTPHIKELLSFVKFFLKALFGRGDEKVRQ